MAKVSFGMIVFNGDHILEPCLESIYPYAHQIIVVEGPVQHWVSEGFLSSFDDTLQILRNFPDPESKIKVITGQWPEKDEMCNEYMKYLEDETHIWHIDSDEVYKAEDVESVLDHLDNYDSVGFKPYSFFGSFNTVLGGWEEAFEMHRIQRVYPGAKWLTHRPPTILNPQTMKPWGEHRHLGYEELAQEGIRLYHYGKIFPMQMYWKTKYYEGIRPNKTISQYWHKVYKPWMLGQRQEVENKFDGPHHFRPSFRGECRTYEFSGTHPEPIRKRMDQLEKRLREEILWAL
jgi:hypothetical protein